MTKVTKLYDRVKALITKNPYLADNDQYLVSMIWYNDIIKTKDIKTMTALELLGMIKRNELPNHDLITRNRRLVEEKCPALRGKTWTERQNKKIVVKNEINDF